MASLMEAWTLRRVWWFTATARTRSRFARTRLGSLWLGLSSLLSMVLLGSVYRSVFAIKDLKGYFLYLGIGLLAWTAISASIEQAPKLFDENARHIRSSGLNPIFYAMEAWAFQLQSLVISAVLVVGVLGLVRPVILLNALLFAWLPILNLLLLLLWLPSLICLLGLRYRDLYQLVPMLLQIVFLLTPILYESKRLGSLHWLVLFNPIYQIINPIRQSILEGHLSVATCLLMLLFNAVGMGLFLLRLKRDRYRLPYLVNA